MDVEGKHAYEEDHTFEYPEDHPTVNLVLIGKSGAGKSTLARTLLYGVNPKPNELVDNLHDEKEKGHSIVAHYCIKELATTNYSFMLIDTPGKLQYASKAVTAMGQADYAVLVVDGRRRLRNVQALKKSWMLQTARHVYVFGVRQIIVCINKMDRCAGKPSEKFDLISKTLRELLREVGYRKKNITFIPISALNGTNVLPGISKEFKNRGKRWSSVWAGDCLLSCMDTLRPPKRETQKYLRLAVNRTYTLQGLLTVVFGHIYHGVLSVGMEVQLSHDKLAGTVETIQQFGQFVRKARAGATVGFTLNSMTRTYKHITKRVRRLYGYGVRSTPEISEMKDERIPRLRDFHVTCGAVFFEKGTARKAVATTSFIAQIVVLRHVKGYIRVGYQPLIQAHSCRGTCTISKILWRHGMRDSKTNQKSSDGLASEMDSIMKNGEILDVEMKPVKEICLEPYHLFPAMGRFVGRDGPLTICAGKVLDVCPSEYQYYYVLLLKRLAPWLATDVVRIIGGFCNWSTEMLK